MPFRDSTERRLTPADKTSKPIYGSRSRPSHSPEAHWRELWQTVTPIWTALALTRILYYGLERLRHPEIIPPVWADAALSIILLPLVVAGSYLTLRSWQRAGLLRAVVASLGSALLFGAAARPVHVAISAHIFGHAGAQDWLATDNAPTSAFWESWLATTVEYGVLYLSSAFGAVGILSYRNLMHERLLRASAEATADRERLRALRMQLNPHFLFNTLNSIVGATYANAEAAHELVERLGEVLRHILLASEQEEHELRDEKLVVEAYARMEQLRTHSRVQWHFDIDAGCDRAAVPTLLLLPLFENAVKHGLRGSVREVSIGVSVSHRGDDLIVSIANTCPPPTEVSLARIPGGVGLRNVRERLHVLFGPRAALVTARPVQTEFKACVTLPYRESD
ncbi:MAG: sensor histidine kinase [Steroidobacteraceae bacterium]